MYGLGFMDCVELFGVKKSQFNSLSAKSILVGEKLLATYSIST